MEPKIKENVLLRLKLNKFVVSEDGVDEVILSRQNNAIMELQNGKIVSSFRFNQLITVVQLLKVFFSYKPKLKHYSFMNGSDLIILRKSNVINVVGIYNDVVNYDIADYCNSGKPHVIISVVNKESPIIIDCASLKPLPRSHTNVLDFAPHIQKAMLRIKNTEKMLHEKTKMISKLSNVLAFSCDDDLILSSTDQLVFLKEGLASAFTGLATKGNALSVGKPWLKTHSDNWIVGFPVVNISNYDIYSFEMFIIHHHITVKKTVLFTKTGGNAEGIADYRQSLELPIAQSGIVVAVIQEPCLMPESFVLACIFRFESVKSDEPEQCFLGSLGVNTLEVRESEAYKLFFPCLSAHDLISIQIASKPFELSFKSELHILEFLNKLESLLSIRRVSDHVFLNSHTSGTFPYLLLIINSCRNRIKAFVNSENEFLLLAHKLVDNLKEMVAFEHPRENSMQVVNAILKEVTLVKKIIIHELIGSESNSPTPEINFEERFRGIMGSEITSAAAMNSLKICQ